MVGLLRVPCSSSAQRRGINGDPAPVPGHACTVLPGMDAAPDDADLASYATNSSQGAAEGVCCGLCADFPGCAAWTLFGGSCYLKPGFEGARNSSAKGIVSGFLGRGPAPPPTPPAPLPQPWAHRGITFTGGRYCAAVAMGSNASLHSMRHQRPHPRVLSATASPPARAHARFWSQRVVVRAAVYPVAASPQC